MKLGCDALRFVMHTRHPIRAEHAALSACLHVDRILAINVCFQCWHKCTSDLAKCLFVWSYVCCLLSAASQSTNMLSTQTLRICVTVVTPSTHLTASVSAPNLQSTSTTAALPCCKHEGCLHVRCCCSIWVSTIIMQQLDDIQVLNTLDKVLTPWVVRRNIS